MENFELAALSSAREVAYTAGNSVFVELSLQCKSCLRGFAYSIMEDFEQFAGHCEHGRLGRSSSKVVTCRVVIRNLRPSRYLPSATECVLHSRGDTGRHLGFSRDHQWTCLLIEKRDTFGPHIISKMSQDTRAIRIQLYVRPARYLSSSLAFSGHTEIGGNMVPTTVGIGVVYPERDSGLGWWR
ncbi:hypothetical protein KCU79_g14, partial [Aureobasidium melanogenum]